MSRSVTVNIGFPQGRQKSPVLFRDYSTDIPASVYVDYAAWKVGEEEDSLEERLENVEYHQESYISTYLKSKDDNEMSPDEKWEEHLLTNVNKVEN
jgi:hypothetical protein